MEFPRTRRETAEWIGGCEKAFASDLQSTALRMTERGSAGILTVAGPTCAGKTTSALMLQKMFIGEGRTASLFSFDDYFRSRPIKNGITGPPPDYDSPDALDLPCLEETIRSMAAGRPAEIPIYSFITGKREGYRIHTPVPGEIQIWEGIQALYPDVRKLFPAETSGVFLQPEPPDIWGINGDTLRLFRRIIRDHRCRGAEPEFTIHIWQNVRDNEIKNILPYLTPEILRLNTCTAYELYVLAGYLLPLLAAIPSSSPYRKQAEAYREILQPFAKQSVDPALVPENALLREFIGSVTI